MTKTNHFIASFNKLPRLLRFLFALPVLDGLVYGVYRIFAGHPVAGLFWLVFGLLPGAVIDMVCIVLKGKITFCA